MKNLSEIQPDPALEKLRAYCAVAPVRPHSLAEIAAVMGVSHMTVARDEQRAFDKLRVALLDWASTASDDETAEINARRARLVQSALFGVGPAPTPIARTRATRRPRAPLQSVPPETLDLPGFSEEEEFAATHGAKLPA